MTELCLADDAAILPPTKKRPLLSWKGWSRLVDQYLLRPNFWLLEMLKDLTGSDLDPIPIGGDSIKADPPLVRCPQDFLKIDAT